MSDAMFAGMTSFGLVVLSVVVASGLAIFVGRATAKTPVGSFLAEPSVAFLCIVVAGTLAFAATVDTPADFVNGVVTNCVVGQLAPGLYLPFAAPVAAAYAASKNDVALAGKGGGCGRRSRVVAVVLRWGDDRVHALEWNRRRIPREARGALPGESRAQTHMELRQ